MAWVNPTSADARSRPYGQFLSLQTDALNLRYYQHALLQMEVSSICIMMVCYS